MGNKSTHVANVADPDQTNRQVGFVVSKHTNVKEKDKSKKLKGGTKRKRSSRNDEDGKKKKVKKVVVSNEVTTLLKEFIIDEIMGSDMKLVIQKTLFESDLKRSQNRLNMPFKQVETHDFLMDEEKRFLGKKTDDAEIEVRLVGSNLQMFKKPMYLKIWSMTNTNNYWAKTQYG
ncbi:B3 domain-containing protein, DNA-binding pseudobarrel domain protein [Tanacetum coccineum]